MISWGAAVPWPGPGVGCFDPALVLHRLREAFGPDLEFEAADLLAGHYERVVQTVAELGIGPNSSTILSAAKLVREVSPRYQFRLRVSPTSFVTGQVDRYRVGVLCSSEGELPEPMRARFIEFLQSLRLGEIQVER